MGDFMDKAKDLADKRDDEVDKGFQQAGDKVDDRTGGKYNDKIEKGWMRRNAAQATTTGSRNSPAGRRSSSAGGPRGATKSSCRPPMRVPSRDSAARWV